MAMRGHEVGLRTRCRARRSIENGVTELCVVGAQRDAAQLIGAVRSMSGYRVRPEARKAPRRRDAQRSPRKIPRKSGAALERPDQAASDSALEGRTDRRPSIVLRQLPPRPLEKVPTDRARLASWAAGAEAHESEVDSRSFTRDVLAAQYRNAKRSPARILRELC